MKTFNYKSFAVLLLFSLFLMALMLIGNASIVFAQESCGPGLPSCGQGEYCDSPSGVCLPDTNGDGGNGPDPCEGKGGEGQVCCEVTDEDACTGALTCGTEGDNSDTCVKPCAGRGPGCYTADAARGDRNVGDTKLSIADFKYYNPISWGNQNDPYPTCECVQADCTPDIPSDEVPFIDEPDERPEACSCIMGTAWDTAGSAGQQCCNDDIPQDCGLVSASKLTLCSLDTPSQGEWFSASVFGGGKIYSPSCASGVTEYLSLAGKWETCDSGNVGTKWNSIRNDYICRKTGAQGIVECRGDNPSQSDSLGAGIRVETGQSIIVGSSDSPSTLGDPSSSGPPGGSTSSDGSSVSGKQYCFEDGNFWHDLDDGKPDLKRKKVCVLAGFSWTGSYCCGEESDEYYNDPPSNNVDGSVPNTHTDDVGVGGCWNNEPVFSVSYVDGTEKSVINYDGSFHGCALDKDNYNTENNDLLELNDDQTDDNLIENHDYCYTEIEDYFCSYQEKWELTNDEDRSHFSVLPDSIDEDDSDDIEHRAACCAQNQCWKGDECIDSQNDKPTVDTFGNGLRCIDGAWIPQNKKCTPDGTICAYCPRDSQCLLDPLATSAPVQCIVSGNYSEDNYCENGEWSSRTKQLALKLLKIKNSLGASEYTLFCDSRENTLNNLQYLSLSGEAVESILTRLEANNFCVLKSRDKIIAATSINKNLEEVPGAMNIFGVTSCPNARGDGEYYSCDGTNRVWYNKQQKSFIYSKFKISVPQEQEPTSFIRNLIRNIVNTIKSLIARPPFDESYLTAIKNVNRLFLTEQSGKAIYGSIEGQNLRNLVVEYRGFSANICEFVNNFNTVNDFALSGLTCNKQGNNYYVLGQGSEFTNLNPETVWPDLTAKLRIQ